MHRLGADGALLVMPLFDAVYRDETFNTMPMPLRCYWSHCCVDSKFTHKAIAARDTAIAERKGDAAN